MTPEQKAEERYPKPNWFSFRSNQDIFKAERAAYVVGYRDALSQAPSGVNWVENDYVPEPFKVVAIKVLLEDNGPRQDWELKWDFVNKEGKWVSHPSFVRLMWLDEASQQTTALQARVEELEKGQDILKQALVSRRPIIKDLESRIAELEEKKDDMFGALLLANNEKEKLMGLLEDRVKHDAWKLHCHEHMFPDTYEAVTIPAWLTYCQQHNLNTEK